MVVHGNMTLPVDISPGTYFMGTVVESDQYIRFRAHADFDIRGSVKISDNNIIVDIHFLTPYKVNLSNLRHSFMYFIYVQLLFYFCLCSCFQT